MNAKEKEKRRSLSPAEQKRLAAFEETAARLGRQGYARRDLTVGIVWANVFAVILGIPVLVAGVILFYLRNGAQPMRLQLLDIVCLMAGYFVLIVLHELVHGLTWACFPERHWRDIEFGFMKTYLTPYCTCLAPLPKGPYILGALMPLLITGLLPAVAGILAGSYTLLLLGVLMVAGAAGDILIVWKILTYRSTAGEVLIYDHPTQAGSVIFER